MKLIRANGFQHGPHVLCLADSMGAIMICDWNIKGIIEIIAALMMPFGFCIYMWFRRTTDEHGKIRVRGIGARAIQFIATIFLLPIILILALEKLLDSQVVGTLIGGLMGYLLSGIANFDKPNGQNNTD